MNLKNNSNLLVIIGPTASGKTRLGVELARRLDGEIISADSRQVYRGLDIGSGKDLGEYGEVPYHLIDIVDPGHEFNVFEFQNCFFEAFAAILSRHKLPLLVGGTGMYLDAALNGYRLVAVPENPPLRRELASLSDEELIVYLRQVKPNLHNTTDLTDRSRLLRAIEIAVGQALSESGEWDGTGEGERQAAPGHPMPEVRPFVLGIRRDRTLLRQRITQRLKQRLETGLVEEVERLHRSGLPWETLEFYGLEYRYVSRYLKGELNRNDLFQKLNSAIHQFAKKQDTWFRRMEKNGLRVHWVDGEGDPFEQALQFIAEG